MIELLCGFSDWKNKIIYLLIILLICLTVIGVKVLGVYTQPYDFEVEADCTLGNVKTDFQGSWKYWNETSYYNDYSNLEIDVNMSYPSGETKISIPKEQSLKIINETKLRTEFQPEFLKLNGLENLNCKYKVKGQVPLRIIEVLLP